MNLYHKLHLITLASLILLLAGCSGGNGQSKEDGVIESLIEKLGGADRNIQMDASAELRKLSEESNDVIPALTDALGNENALIRAGAADTLGEIGKTSEVPEEALVKLLEDDEVRVRVSAAGALAVIRDDAGDVLPVLIEGLRAGDADVRLKTVFAFIFFKPKICKGIPEAVPHLIELLDDADVRVRTMVSSALWQFGRAAVNGLIKALGDESIATRYNAARAFQYLGPDAIDALPALIETLGDDESRVAIYAAIAIAKISPDDAGPALDLLIEGLLVDDGSGTRNISAEALADMGPAAEKAVPTLLKTMKTAEGFARVDIAFALTRISESHIGTGLGVLIEELASDDQVARLLAAQYLGEIGPDASSALPKLKEMTDTDEVEYVRKAVSKVIEKIEIDDTTETK